MSNLMQSGERSVRSVFVGNIPYDATEEKLKDIFNEVGPVVSFRLVYDRETGKPKGYGFCEYRDQETAMSAMRNLNGFELNSRILRVDNAANEKTKEEIRNLQQSMNGCFESPYGPEIDPETAPEEITKVVASLPPEQMFELAKQMKQCIQSNPTEAKNMLLQNPQLCYGLLQALVVMRVVDPNIALKMLHRSNPVKLIKPQDMNQHSNQQQQPTPAQLQPPIISNLAPQLPPQLPPNLGSWPTQTDQFGRTIPTPLPNLQPNMQPQPVINNLNNAPVNPPPQASFDPRMYNRMQNIPANNLDPRIRQQTAQQASINQPVNLDPRQFNQQQQPQQQPPPNSLDPRSRSQAALQNNNGNNRNQQTNINQATASQQFNPNQSRLVNQPNASTEDQERAVLIMRVLQLSDEQIANLPDPQRQSVLQLKQQIQASNLQN